KRGRSLDNICPVGDPLRISDTIRPFLCGNDPGKPQCPPLYQCLVQRGNDYGVCCPASLKIQKTGTCPPPTGENQQCGSLCTHDLECPSVQKCCRSDQCGSSCVHPTNVTECFHQRALSEVLAVSERAGRGYVPQCTTDGRFEPKQCSRNGLVCWCVDWLGRKLKGSMGPAESVNCSLVDARPESAGRSLDKNGNECEQLECAMVCEYGFKLDDDGCHTCKCDDPCDGYMCPEDEECVNVKESSCTDFLCPSLPVCRPKAVYANPCDSGTPLTDDLSGAPVACALRSEDGTVCPATYDCTSVPGSTQAVCCPKSEETMDVSSPEDSTEADARPQTMCEYLHEFSENMEGTRDGMSLALPTPECDSEGNYLPTQCAGGECWCVDHFGTEIPRTRGEGNSSKDCVELRETLDCLDLTCRMGCEYGFVLSEDTGCPQCQCRDPCSSVTCQEDEQCQLVEVSCKDHYCPPVPSCLPKKVGQCPYLIPATTTSCDFECNSDMACNGTMRCCSNGCGTQCTEPLLLTACQHQRALAQHQAHESGIPAGKVYMPKCKEDGSYDDKQCNPGIGQCWCVDIRGFEISETRHKSGENVSCDPAPRSEKCPLLKCVEDCEHGFEMDAKGCRTCTCVDPCSRVSCRGEGETCRLVAVECVGWPCPSVPMCLPKKENPCQNGEPLRLGGAGDELATCGPDFDSCPSSHKCQLSPVGSTPSVVPNHVRDVCFEPLDKGNCEDEEESRNLTRYHFNSKTNKCEQFTFKGCHGNHNNFHTEDMCNNVCPVLSQCERLREKNQRAAERYKKPTFAPRCEPTTGAWQAVQCLEHVGVCWCVTPQGEPLKGTLTRGAEPECNFRQARNRASDRSDFVSDADLVTLNVNAGKHSPVPATDSDELITHPHPQQELGIRTFPDHHNDELVTQDDDDYDVYDDPSSLFLAYQHMFIITIIIIAALLTPSGNFILYLFAVLEELMMQLGSIDDVDEPDDLKAEDDISIPFDEKIPPSTRCEALGGQCDEKGQVSADPVRRGNVLVCGRGGKSDTQHEHVREGRTCLPNLHPVKNCLEDDGTEKRTDNSGVGPNRLKGRLSESSHASRLIYKPFSVANLQGAVVPIKVEMTIGFRGEYDDITAQPVINQITKIIASLNGNVDSDGIRPETTSDVLYIRFSLIGSNKVDVSYKLDQMVKQQLLPGLTADLTRSRVVHTLSSPDLMPIDRVAALEQREIVSQSPVSVVAPYHTALIVIAAASSFVICVLTLLVILYRRKMNHISAQKAVDDSRFLSGSNRPIYIELPNEKYSSLSPDLNARKT
ncbi:hypothetical protein NQ318_004047, partial [Aromia moschata]